MDADTEQPPEAAQPPEEAQRLATHDTAVEQPQQPQQQHQQALRPLSGRHGGGFPPGGWAAPPPWGFVPQHQGQPPYGMPYPYAQVPPWPVGGGGGGGGAYGQQQMFGLPPPQGHRPPPPGPVAHGVCDWLVHRDEEGDAYYENTRSGFTTWVRPAVGLWGDPSTRPVPIRSVPVHGCSAPWVEVTCDDGKVFWHDEKVSTWTMPVAVQHARAQQQQQQQRAVAAAAAPHMMPPPMPPRMPPPMPMLPPAAADEEEEFDPTFDEEDIAPTPQEATPAEKAQAVAAAAAAEAAAADAKREAEAKAAATAEAYRQLLREVGVTAHTTWAAVLPRLSVDARFRAIASLSQRRSLFDAHVKELKQPPSTAKAAAPGAAASASAALAAKEAAARKRKAADAQLLDRERRKAEELRRREAFRTLLSEAIRDAEATFPDWQATLARDPQGRGVPTADDGPLPAAHMAQLFDEHVKGLALHYAQQFKQLLGERLSAAVAAQHGNAPGNPCGSFEAAEALLGHEQRWQRCLPSDRHALWRSHCGEVMPAAGPAAGPAAAAPAHVADTQPEIRDAVPVPVHAMNADDLLRDLDDA